MIAKWVEVWPYFAITLKRWEAEQAVAVSRVRLCRAVAKIGVGTNVHNVAVAHSNMHLMCCGHRYHDDGFWLTHESGNS